MRHQEQLHHQLKDYRTVIAVSESMLRNIHATPDQIEWAQQRLAAARAAAQSVEAQLARKLNEA